MNENVSEAQNKEIESPERQRRGVGGGGGGGDSLQWVPEMAIGGRYMLLYLAGNSVGICLTA